MHNNHCAGVRYFRARHPEDRETADKHGLNPFKSGVSILYPGHGFLGIPKYLYPAYQYLGKPKFVMPMEVPLTSLAIDQAAIVRHFIGGQHFQHKLRMMGIREGKVVKLLASQPLMGPIVIEIDRRELTIGRRMAKHIIVETA